ncbi:MAG TPA: AsmA-like C-terminal region-containing protein [Parafilimonas sp.]|nr:AsmA-like C-terminal region-containing protein [Parafilimonas sp.]
MLYASIKNKTLRILAWIFTGIISLILLLFIIANIYVHYNKQKLLDVINSNINKNISGKFEVKDIEITTLSHFPNISVELKNISLLDSVYHRPLLQCALLSCRFNIFKIWGVDRELSKLVIEHGAVSFFTDSAGYKNTSMFKKKEKTPSTTKNTFTIHQVEMTDMSFRIDDAPKAKHYHLQFEKLSAAIDQQDSVMLFNVNEKALIRQLTFNEARGAYLENHTIEGRMKLRFNTSAKTLSCNNADLEINDQPYTISALFRFTGQPDFHIEATTKKLLYSKGVALLTPKLRNTLGNIQLKAPLDVHAVLDGLLKYRAIPAININWQTEKNELSAGSITFKDCSFTGTFVNQIADTLPRTDEFSRVVLQTFSGNLDGLQMEGKNIVATNLLKPYVQFDLKSNAALNQLENLIASEQVNFLTGKVQMALLYNGPLLTDPALLKNLTAQLSIQDGSIQYAPKNVLLENCNGEMTIGNNQLSFKDFQFDFLHSHIKINITGNDIASFSYNETGKAAVAINLYSPHLHVDEIMNAFAADDKAAGKKNNGKFASVTNSINNVFNTLDFRMHVQADTLSRGSFHARHLNADLLLKKDAWQLENISMYHAGGTVRATGSMIRNARKQVILTTDIQLQQLNVQQLFRAFDNFGQDGMTAENLRGNFTATVHVSTQLRKGNGRIVSEGMNGYMDFSLKNGAIINHKGLEKVKVLFLKDRDMSNIRFDELKDRIDIYPHSLYINRMEIQSTAVTLFIEGMYDFQKKNTDILIQVPLSNMKKREKDYKAKNKGVNAKTGTSVLIRALNDDKGDIIFNPTLSKKVKGKKEK